MNTFLKTIAAFSVIGISLSSVGCMISPNQGDHFADRDSWVKFSGVTLVPDETVMIQAKNKNTGAWMTIDTFQTAWSGGGVKWDGKMWYFGNGYVQIPHECWKLHLLGSADRVYYSAEVRLMTESGYALNGFNNGFEEWFWSNINLYGDEGHRGTPEEFAERMNGKTSVTIYTDVMAPGW